LQVNGDIQLNDPEHPKGFGIYHGTHSTLDYYDTLLAKSLRRTADTTFEMQSDGSNAGFSAMDMQFRALRFYTGTTASASAVDVNITDLPSYERMCILSNGNVGIGTTSPIGNLSVVRDTVVAGSQSFQRGMFYKDGKLQITPPDLYNGYPLNGDFITTTRYETDGTTDYTGAALGTDYDSNGSSSLYFKTAASASSCTEKVRILGNGNVGIGTIDPLGVLTVKSNYSGGTSSGFCLDATDGTVYNLRLSSYVHASAQVAYKFTVNNVDSSVDALNFGYNGNVGIGTSSPSIALDVPGGIATPGYHAQHATTCSGLVKWTGTHLSWLHRCIALPVEKSEFGLSGYIDMYLPATGTSIIHYSGTTGVSSITTTADGFPIGTWEALWYVVTPGQSHATVNSQYVITDHHNDTWKPNSNWILLAVHNGDSAGGGSTYLKFMPTNGNFYKWIALPFVNAWVSYDSTYNPGSYYRDGDGVVHLRGLIKNGTSTTICTLPEGFRPEGRLLTHCISNGYPASRIDITTAGVVTLEHSTYDAGWLSLEGISFKAYQ
jgi:hypothetical protein